MKITEEENEQHANELHNFQRLLHLCIAYFLDVLDNEKVYLHDMQPESISLDCLSSVKETYYGKVFITDFELENLSKHGADTFFDDYFKKEIKKCAIDFSNKVKIFPNLDVIFESLPGDIIYFLTAIAYEDKTKFNARLMKAYTFDIEKPIAFLFEFKAVFINKINKIDIKNDATLN